MKPPPLPPFGRPAPGASALPVADDPKSTIHDRGWTIDDQRSTIENPQSNRLQSIAIHSTAIPLPTSLRSLPSLPTLRSISSLPSLSSPPSLPSCPSPAIQSIESIAIQPIAIQSIAIQSIAIESLAIQWIAIDCNATVLFYSSRGNARGTINDQPSTIEDQRSRIGFQSNRGAPALPFAVDPKSTTDDRGWTIDDTHSCILDRRSSIVD